MRIKAYLEAPIITVFCILLTIGCQESKNGSSPSGGPPPSRAPRVMNVDGFIAKGERLESVISATGSLVANESVQITPERAGKLEEILFRESSIVRKGNILARIDDDELQAQLNKLKLQEQMAIREEARGKQLLDIQGISKENYDRLVDELEQVRADIKLVEVQISKTDIRAPFSGLLGLRAVSVGAYVSPSTPIVDLQQTNPIKLEFDVPERYMRDLKIGQSVTFSVVGFAEPFDASIYAMATEISSTTRSFKVLARCQNASGTLKPGNFAKVDVTTGVNENAVLIPTDAVIPVIDGQQVFMVKDGKSISSMVNTGERRGAMIEIVDGVSPGDTVIISGLLSLSESMPVNIATIVDFDPQIH